MSEDQRAIEENYRWFITQLADLMKTDAGRYALIHERRLLGTFETPGAAEREGERLHPGAPFSIQPIELGPVDMGYYSYASS